MSEYNDDRTPSEGGLFSDDCETPKRENPYLRKNREKNKPEKQPKPQRDKPETEKPARKARPDGDGYQHKRTFSDFLFEHIKLIAAVASIAVVLSLVLITDVVGIVEKLITQSEQADKEPITLLYVEGLTKKSEPITWSDLSRFRRDSTEGDDSVTWMLEVEGTDYEVWISGVSTQNPPTYVYLFDMRSGDRMDLNEDDFTAFVNAHS